MVVFQKLIIHRCVFRVELNKLFRVVRLWLLQPVAVGGSSAANFCAFGEGKLIFCLGHKFILLKDYLI